MLNKNDKIIEVRLYSPHKCDFVCEREDGTHYVYIKRDLIGYYELHRNGDGWIYGEKLK